MMKATVQVQVACPECRKRGSSTTMKHAVVAPDKEVVYCDREGCNLFQVPFDVPTIELERTMNGRNFRLWLLVRD